jgi:[ribosomal protein S18]-alanine N-acetyltransferase
MRLWPFSRKTEEASVRPLESRWFAICAHFHAQFFARAWTLADFEDLARDRQVIADGAFDGAGNSCFGFAISRLVAPEAELLSIAVDRRLHGRGIGRQLLAAHLAGLGARGAREVFLEVEQGNIAAVGLYERFGFAKVGERAGYYPKKDGSRATALVMRAQLR